MLHLHMVLWLSGSPSTKKMKALLLMEEFRTRIQNFITANIHADLPGYPGNAVLTIPVQPQVAFSRPENPKNPQYEKRQREAEQKIARTVQVHCCSKACLKVCNSRLVCKCQAPFALSNEDWINDKGK